MPRPTIPDRRETLLDVAERLVLERGFDAMSVQSVADAAGVSKGGVYREFAGKHELLDAVLLRATTRLGDRVEALTAHLPRPVPLSALYRAGVEALLDDPLMSAAMLDDRAVLGEHVRTVGPERYRARFHWVTGHIEELRAAGRVRADLDAEAVSLALSSVTIGLLSASALIGPFTHDQLRSALDVIAGLVHDGIDREEP
jgi:AcrR family transcriptional regulator